MGLDDDSKQLTRREFLKLLGYGAGVVAGAVTFGGLYNNLGLNEQNKSGLTKSVVYAQTPGSWSLGVNMLTTPIHASLLPNGKILYITGSDYVPTQQSGPYTVGILDPISGSQSSSTVADDIFCCGNCVLPNGNVLVTGGTLEYPQNSPNGKWWGRKEVYEYDFLSNSFIQRPSMAHGRWYPTQVVLPDGTVSIFSGFDEFGCINGLLEIYDPNSQSFTMKFDPGRNKMYCVGACTTLPGAGSPCYGGPNNGTIPSMTYYPRITVMPSGLLACAGMNPPLQTWDPSTGRWVIGGPFAINQNRVYGTSVLLPMQNNTNEGGKILLIGGAPSTADHATNQCEIVRPKGKSLKTWLTAPMQNPRMFFNATLLPTGTIFVNGGTTYANNLSDAVYAAEMFDPTTETWTTMPSATVPRRYHSIALLLPDGRVWTAGTTIGLNPPGELRTEIFSPSYVFATRPVISGIPAISGGYGGSITIPTQDAPNIASVSLVKMSSVTHHWTPDQRMIWLQIKNSNSNSLTVKAPINANIAPPGYYLIHVLDGNGIPSVGQFIKMPA